MDNETQKQSKPKAQKQVTPNPQPGKFEVRSKVVMRPTAGKSGSFTHDPVAPVEIAHAIASKVHGFAQLGMPEPDEFPEFKVRTYRMVSMFVAKKLANSLSSDQELGEGGNLSAIAKVAINGPSGLIPLIDNFGAIDTDGLRFEMIGQPVLALSYFGRATQRALADRENALFVNLRWNGHKKILFDYFLGVINAWSSSVPIREFNFGNGAILNMKIPEIAGGLAAFQQLIQGIPRPPDVTQAVEAGVILEPFLNGNLTQQAMQALEELGVWAVDWDTATLVQRSRLYLDDVEARLRTSMSKMATWVKVAPMKTNGTAVQLLRRPTEYLVEGPIKVTPEDLDVGWLTTPHNPMVKLEGTPFHGLLEETVFEGLSTYFDKVFKT